MTFESRPFGKRDALSESKENSLEKRFAQMLEKHEDDGTTGDSALDELIGDYIGILAFNEVAGVMGDMAALERDKNLILDYLKKHPTLKA
jgi:hypothetical protein